jgi:hypothetical protein
MALVGGKTVGKTATGKAAYCKLADVLPEFRYLAAPNRL